MTRKLFTVIGLLFITLLFAWPLADTASAKVRRSPRQTFGQAMNEDKRPWGGFPWLIGGALTAGAFVVGMKNAKRTHLD